ncbi:unnamed protein product [Ceutorhynchus assimilis]|uniref:Elongation factor EFG domain-containing protein n=1 Tax=Ceutorhynchus assimilis TaxID=467358 RepID=A0A9P0DC71_9CUCU|nr:unnamed protein product [Ceutorhynchus assimilis]
MILIINKLDRLIMELDQDIDLMFQTLIKIIEDCNVIVAECYQYGFSNNGVDIEDTGLLFNPETGNVIFASAIDGWGFTTKQFCRMMINMVRNETIDSLNKKVWNFDYWVDSKGEIKTGAVDKHKPNIFIQLILKTIVHIYQTLAVRMDKDKAPAILKKLNITNPTREMTISNDPKAQIRSILSSWKPLAKTILLQCLNILPSPNNMGKDKIQYLLNSNHYLEDPYLNTCVEEMSPHFETSSIESPTICYVSKMFCISTKCLSENAPKAFVPKPRQIPLPVSETEKLTIENKKKVSEIELEPIELTEEQKIKQISDEIAVIALARIFTGELKTGDTMYAMTDGYLPNENRIAEDLESFIAANKFVSEVRIEKLYMLFGRELILVDSVPAGNFCGIGGIDSIVLRTATLSTKIDVVPLVEHPTPYPVVRYAIEPVNPKELPILRFGLKLLMQSDSCVQVIMQETGELVILTAGNVHLEKCIEDLKKKFAKIEIQVSSPMVALRETISNNLVDSVQYIEINTPNMNLSLTVVFLPPEITKVIEHNHELLRNVEEHQHFSLIDLIRKFNENSSSKNTKLHPKLFKSDLTNRSIIHVREQLKTAFQSSGLLWANMHNTIWSVGRIHDCANLLLNGTEDYKHNIFVDANVKDKRTLLAQCIVNPFHNFSKAGPISEEPLMNCAFIIKKFELVGDIQPEEITPQLVSSIESAVKNAMKNCFEKQEPRLMEPMYTTSIQVNTSILGKVYSVINKRHGKVLEAVGMDEKEKLFLVQAQIPVLESEGFADEIRKTTSGQANPSLRFSHYEIIDGDPFFEPVEDEEDSEDEYEVKLELGLRANKLRRDVRRRKGLHVEDEVVVHAEKQRTLNKKK